MSTIEVGIENSSPIELYYEDQGSGAPVLLIHGWPFDSRSWEPQVHTLLVAGYRVITYDRRGFGRSSRPATGYDFDTLADDLDVVLNHLDLSDVTLVGFSLGTGELARYLGTRGTQRVRSCVFIESLAPSFVKSDDNPKGVDEAGVDAVQQLILQDRPAWLAGVLKDFLNLEDYLGGRVSEETVRSLWNAGNDASPHATWACPRTWLDDYQQDITRIDIPTLIVHGTADRILSIEGQGRRLHAALPESQLVEIDGGPHLVCVTHSADVNAALLTFLQQPVDSPPAERPAMSSRAERAAGPADALAGTLHRTELQHQSSSIPGRDIVQVRTEIPAGVASGWHTHPGEEVGYIVAGVVQMEIRDRPTLTLHPGDGFLIPPLTPHNALDLGPETGQMLSTYLVEAGQPIATFTQ